MTYAAPTRPRRLTRWLVLAVGLSLLGLSIPGDKAHAATTSIMVSSSPSRANAVALSGTTRAGSLYIFATPTAGVVKVTFWLDDPQRSGLPKQVESYAPFDFRGGTDAAAVAWDSTLGRQRYPLASPCRSSTTPRGRRC